MAYIGTGLVYTVTHSTDGAILLSKLLVQSNETKLTLIRLPVNSSRGHLVTRVSSHSQLVTSEHIRKPSVVKFFICTPVRLRPDETVLNTDDVITASEHTRHAQCRAVRV